MRPPNANTGNPIATERYTTSSTKSVLIFLKYGFTHAPTRLRIIKRAIIYNKPPTTTDQRTVFNLHAESEPFIQLCVVIKGSILSLVIIVEFFFILTHTIIYNKQPTTTDQRTVFNLRAESAPFIQLGVVIKGSILSGVIVVGFFSLCTPTIGGI